jgi:ABC-type transport system involved in multi-copper enzyme maturation permease subunit
MFVNFKKLVFVGTLVRLLLLNAFFILLLLAAFFFVKIHGIHFSRPEVNHFLYYSLFLLITLVFFYLAGMLLTVLFKFRKVVFLWMFVFWVIFMFLIPEFSRIFIFNKARTLPSNESFSLRQLKALLAFEHNAQEYFTIYPPPKDADMDQIFRKFTTDFLENVHNFSKSQELNLNNDIKNIVHSYEYISTLFPTQFYYFLAGEISSKGYYGYTDFADYVIKSQEKFVRYYLNKKFVLKEKKVESFVKGDENVFKAQSHLPNAYWPGLTAVFCYCLAMFMIAYFRLKRLLCES